MLSEKILSGLGRFYLYLRLQSKAAVEQELNRKYEGSFRNAGLVLLFDLLMALAVVAFVGLIATVLYLAAS